MLLTSITQWGCVVFYCRHSQEACSSLYKCDTKQNVFIETFSWTAGKLWDRRKLYLFQFIIHQQTLQRSFARNVLHLFWFLDLECDMRICLRMRFLLALYIINSGLICHAQGRWNTCIFLHKHTSCKIHANCMCLISTIRAIRY